MSRELRFPRLQAYVTFFAVRHPVYAAMAILMFTITAAMQCLVWLLQGLTWLVSQW